MTERTTASLGILLLSGTHDRVHTAFLLAAGAAAMDRRVVLFATGRGAHALFDDWSGLDDVGRDAVIRRRGVAGVGELREAATELGVRMIVCEAGLRAEGTELERLWQGVTVAGIASFLEESAGGQLVSL